MRMARDALTRSPHSKILMSASPTWAAAWVSQHRVKCNGMASPWRLYLGDHRALTIQVSLLLANLFFKNFLIFTFYEFKFLLYYYYYSNNKTTHAFSAPRA